MRPVRQAAERARRHHPSGDLRIRTIRRPRRQGRLKCATGGWRRSGWCPFRISALAERLPRSARQDRSGLFFYESAAHEYGLPPWYRVGRASLSAYILSTAPNCWQKLAQLKARRETLQVVATQISFVRPCAAGPACLRDRSLRLSAALQSREISVAPAGCRRATQTVRASARKSRALARHTAVQAVRRSCTGPLPRTACR